MNSKTLFTALVVTIALAATNPTKASNANSLYNSGQPQPSSLLHDTNMEQFMVELSTHRDSGRAALRDRITDIEQREGQFSPKLYGYLAELGRIYRANAEHDLAMQAFQRMQTLTHWADGVNSPLQLESVRLQSRSLIAQGKIVQADKLERFHLRVAEKSYDGEALLPSLWRMSSWQRATLQYDKALKNYDRTLDIIEAEELPDAFLVRAMEAKALTEHLAKRCCADDSLETALAGRLNSEFSDHAANQTALLNLADLNILYGSDEAMPLYSQLDYAPPALLGPRSKNAYLSALDSVDSSGFAMNKEVWYPQQTSTFTFSSAVETEPEPVTIGEPVRLCSSQIDTEGYVDVSLEVSLDGTPQNLVITGDASRTTKKYLRAVLLKSRYRPEIRDGEAIEQKLTFRQYFDRSKPVRSDLVSGWRDLLAEHACQIVAMR